MKKSILFLLMLTGIIFSACSTTKQASSKELYSTTWELDFITGSRIAFDGLYPNEKPNLTFDKESNRVHGTNSCNGYSYKFTLDNEKLTFSEPGPATLRYCEGNGDKVFLEMMEKVESFSFDENNKLNLMANGIPVMRFKKTNNN
ncbi:META domain-containing protein [uncultured Flavobacterium sp.]|uniref:META domain-containing protein n=1 Tax=uncultured Flavobacterium sp. TaxID=165435 RepID=UPI0030C7A30C